nr:transposase [Komagataeibacter diospyri]
MRRNPADGNLAYFTVWCPSGTTPEKLAQVEGTRWRIEERFITAKNEFGLDHNETHSWHGWQQPSPLWGGGGEHWGDIPALRIRAEIKPPNADCTHHR